MLARPAKRLLTGMPRTIQLLATSGYLVPITPTTVVLFSLAHMIYHHLVDSRCLTVYYTVAAYLN